MASQKEFSKIGVCNYSHIASKNYQCHAWGGQAQFQIDSLIGELSSTVVELTRGCIFNCPYCFRTGFRQVFRKKALKDFEAEINQLSNLNIGYVFFIDETFGLDWNLYVNACQILKQKGIRFGFQTRPDLLNSDRIKTLKTLGCVYIEFGLEANEEPCLKSLAKFANFKMVKENVDLAKSVIGLVNVNILDLTNPDYINKVPSITQLDNEGNSPPPLIPYPSTDMGNRALEHYKHLFPTKPVWELAELVYLYYSVRSGIISELGIIDGENISKGMMKVLDFKEKIADQSVTRFQRLFPK